MDFKIVNSVNKTTGYDCLLIPVINGKLPSSVKKLDRELAANLNSLSDQIMKMGAGSACEFIPGQIKNKSTSVALLHFDSSTLKSVKEIEKTLAQAISQLRKCSVEKLLISLTELKPYYSGASDLYTRLTKLLIYSNYQYSETKTVTQTTSHIDNVTYFEPFNRNITQLRKAIRQAKSIATSINIARSLSDLPANICTPRYLAQQALAITDTLPIEVQVLNETEIKDLRMNLLLAVAQGSAEPPRQIVMSYRGSKTNQPPILLIGKGLTFDSGGYSIKSALAMDEMKFDMCGAAVVMAVLRSISQMKLPVNLIGIIPSSENLINGKAFKPGDVLTSMSGQTVEILSTDAEGRLLLADSMTYSERYQPTIVIDVATLTGACITALGYDVSGLFSNNKTLSDRLVRAGNRSRDYVWPLPAWPEYGEILNSNFADIASSAGRDRNYGAGASVAAVFLSRFTNNYRWAHLDIAGTAWERGKNKGATGRPVSLLCQFILDYCQKPF